MALYEYKCQVCGLEFEERHLMGTAPNLTGCPECGLRIALRVLSVPPVHYKARGFTGAGRAGDGRIDHFRHADGSPLTEADKNQVPPHLEES